MNIHKKYTAEEEALLEEVNRRLPKDIDWKAGAETYLSELTRTQGPHSERYHLVKPFIGGPDFQPFVDDMGRFVSLVEKANLASNSRIVDVGCGQGSTSYFLAKLGHHVLGIDISKELIEIARRRIASDPFPPYIDRPFSASFRVFDIENEVLDGEFDFAIFESTLHHFHDPLAALKNVRRCLHDEGLIAIIEAVAPEPGSPNDLHFHEIMTQYRTLERPFSRDQITRLLHFSGFEAQRFFFPLYGFFEQTAECAQAIHNQVLYSPNWNIVFASPTEAGLRRLSPSPTMEGSIPLRYKIADALDAFSKRLPFSGPLRKLSWTLLRSVMKHR